MYYFLVILLVFFFCINDNDKYCVDLIEKIMILFGYNVFISLKVVCLYMY